MSTRPDAGSGTFKHPSFWRGRTLRSLAVAVAAVLLLRLGVGWHLAREAQRQREDLRRRGEPLAYDQLALPRPSEADNAWALQMKAHAAIDPAVDSPRTTSLVFPDAPPYGAPWTRLADASEKAHGPVFAMMRQARALPAARLRPEYSTASFLAAQPYFNDARHLANTVVDGAEWAHARGDDAEALERLRDTLHLARSMRQDATLIGQLVAIGIEALTCHGTQVTAPGLRLGAGDPGAPAARASARALIAELLDESREPKAFADALRTERLMYEDMLRTEGGRTWVIRPLADAELARNNAMLLAGVEAAAAGNWPAAQRVLERHDPKAATAAFPAPRGVAGPAAEIPRYSRWFTLPVSLSRAFVQQFRVLAERRVTAVSLAAQAYRADHGRWPARLQDLVPVHLPAVPADPFHADGRPLDYVLKPAGLPDGGDRPLVIFGTQTRPATDPTAGLARWAKPIYGWYPAERQYRDLARFQPPPALGPATPSTPSTSSTQPSTDRVDQNPG